MWLVNSTTLKLEEFFDGEVPKYAILSHTWGKQEVSFHDVQEGNAVEKEGYSKISNSCALAVRNGLEYIWIDTCCIDKKSSAELSEAINSMFRWYQNAQVCYAYLADVPSSDNPRSPGSDFAKSRWFTRGWTLQELLAPKVLEFYSKDWSHLGAKSESDLATVISEITGIDIAAFGNRRVSSYSVAQRMSWASKRRTTRAEDEAYCLTGLFSVNMPMLYGEGHRAFRRLQEEILKASDDHSIFAWTAEPLKPESKDLVMTHLRGLLAKSPSEFKNSGNVIHSKNWKIAPYSMTNQGLCITLPHLTVSNKTVAVLDCVQLGHRGKLLGIYLHELTTFREKTFFRMLPTETIAIEAKDLWDSPLCTIYVPDPALPTETIAIEAKDLLDSPLCTIYVPDPALPTETIAIEAKDLLDSPLCTIYVPDPALPTETIAIRQKIC